MQSTGGQRVAEEKTVLERRRDSLVQNLFVIILRYLVSSEEIEPHRGGHIKLLNQYYDSGLFVASGRQVPGNGGIILAKSDNRKALEEILQQDPFSIHRLAEYQIFEFTPSRHSDTFKTVLQ